MGAVVEIFGEGLLVLSLGFRGGRVWIRGWVVGILKGFKEAGSVVGG